jgi:hypothetical protein
MPEPIVGAGAAHIAQGETETGLACAAATPRHNEAAINLIASSPKFPR